MNKLYASSFQSRQYQQRENEGNKSGRATIVIKNKAGSYRPIQRYIMTSYTLDLLLEKKYGKLPKKSPDHVF